jgi:hypothetical protein
MNPPSSRSEYRFEKQRAEAVIILVANDSITGCFFTAAGSPNRAGAERIGDLLNSDPGFFPFEVHADQDTTTVLYNRAHVIAVRVLDDEVRRDPGYAVARRHGVSILLSNGERLDGEVRVYRPEGRDRLSDWTRQPEVFRYVETSDATYIINALHIVAVTEVLGS